MIEGIGWQIVKTHPIRGRIDDHLVTPARIRFRCLSDFTDEKALGVSVPKAFVFQRQTSRLLFSSDGAASQS
ncbi:Unannotated [Lentimonas sp. CC4]|nr:Unannotated [Lentimonas sp. CC4]CAA6687545.1 Unannotated [Lentimonas sp. CC6]CAA7076744.1 Unannotated [Lentimonas sp. CC4]CAA7171976.1 Unannotated [Lentimonas sp. CC21]CAA7183608.1 Unannotated [Lentimonas sp. CC8]